MGLASRDASTGSVIEVEVILATTGKVLWFNPVMGHGYIQPTDGDSDIPVHRLAVELAGHKTLKSGQEVQYEKVRGLDGRPSAVTLKLLK
jgi:CspA family cold shock protein